MQNTLRSWLSRHRKKSVGIGVALALGLSMGAAYAAFTLTMKTGVTTKVVTDWDGTGLPPVGGDTDPTVGVINFSGTVGAYRVNIVGSESKPITPYGPTTASMGLQGSVSPGSGTYVGKPPISFEMADTGFSFPNPAYQPWTFSSSVSGSQAGATTSIGGSATLAPSAGPSTTLTNPAFVLTGLTFSGMDTKSTTLTGSVPYTLSGKVVITPSSGRGAIGFTQSVGVSAVAPEAPAMAMLLPGLLPMGLLLLKLRRKNQA